ncbi:unnamed protein product [Rhizophagus irregularis]|nr:unnamed protein product [Rhizophagus irregularis]CAB4409365.1 unnamed protein product [Rhizophagus irregularis]
MIDGEPRDAGWWIMALKMVLSGKFIDFHSGFYPNYTKIRAHISNDQYKKHARVQDTTTTDTSSSSSNKIHALITITDTGCSISPSFLSTNIFQPFSQENSLQIVTGLGLSIVKLLVE